MSIRVADEVILQGLHDCAPLRAFDLKQVAMDFALACLCAEFIAAKEELVAYRPEWAFLTYSGEYEFLEGVDCRFMAVAEQGKHCVAIELCRGVNCANQCAKAAP